MKLFKKIFFSVMVLLFSIVVYGLVQLYSRPDLENFTTYFIDQNTNTTSELSATFLGTSTLLIQDDSSSILIDGFFTNPSKGDLISGNILPNKTVIQNILQQADIKSLDAVIPVHAHHDHAMDAPEVCLQTGAMLMGCFSTANIARGWGLPEEQITDVDYGDQFQIGQFTITFIESVHSCINVMGLFEKCGGGEMTNPMHFPASVFDFGAGKTFSIFIEHPQRNLLMHASTNVLAGELEKYQVQADVVFMGIAGYGEMDAEIQQLYYDELVNKTNAEEIYLVHWNDFTYGLDQPLKAFPYLVDNLDNSLNILEQKKGENQSISIHLPRMWDKINLEK